MRKQLKDFIDQIGKDAVAVIPAAHEMTRSYDTEFKFHQDPDFYYLTGFPEPDAIAVIDVRSPIGWSRRTTMASGFHPMSRKRPRTGGR